MMEPRTKAGVEHLGSVMEMHRRLNPDADATTLWATQEVVAAAILAVESEAVQTVLDAVARRIDDLSEMWP